MHVTPVHSNVYVVAAIADACTQPYEASGKAVLAVRGECSFIDKAEAAGAGLGGAAAALIVVNNETSLFHMGVHPRYGRSRHSRRSASKHAFRYDSDINIINIERLLSLRSGWYVVLLRYRIPPPREANNITPCDRYRVPT